MKYIDAELLRAVIKEHILFYAGQANLLDGTNTLDGYDEVLAIIDSLQQEQLDVNLEKEIDACWQSWLSPSNQKEVEGVLPKTEFAMYAHHFAEWMAQQGFSQEEIVEDKTLELGYGSFPGIDPIINLPDLFKPGDKVIIQVRKIE